MELRINQETKIQNKSSNKRNLKSSSQNFKNILNAKKAFSSAFDPLGHLSDKGLKAVNKLEKIFGIKITNSDFKNDGYLDIMKIIREKGNNVSPDDVEDLRKSLILAVNADLIDIKDAYEALNWLKGYILSLKLKDDEIKELLNALDLSKNPLAFTKPEK